MDRLPPDIVAHIFHFLSGNDVSIFKRLSSRTKQIVKDNRRSISLPRFHIYVEGIVAKSKDMYLSILGPKCPMPTFEIGYNERKEFRLPDNSIVRKFIGRHDYLSFYDFFSIILGKADIALSMKFPLSQPTLTAFGNAIIQSNGQFTTIYMALNDDTFTDIADCLLFIADKLKKRPPFRILPSELSTNHEWMPAIVRLGQAFTDIAFNTNKICIILELIVKRLLFFPDEPVNVRIDCGIHRSDNPCGFPSSTCGFRSARRGTDCLLHVISQLPQQFVENHSYDIMPEWISFEATPDCELTLTKKDGFVYIQTTFH